jgi:hypothetical protein
MIRSHPNSARLGPHTILKCFQYGDRDGGASGSSNAGAFPRKIRGLIEWRRLIRMAERGLTERQADIASLLRSFQIELGQAALRRTAGFVGGRRLHRIGKA